MGRELNLVHIFSVDVGISTQYYHCSNYYLTVFKNQDQSLVYGTLIEQINVALVSAQLSFGGVGLRYVAPYYAENLRAVRFRPMAVCQLRCNLDFLL